MEKMKHYSNLGHKHGVAIIHRLACETYGRMGQQFLDFIAEAAEHATSKVDSLDHACATGEASKTRASYARRLRQRWLRLISLTRVRTIAERLCGASASAAKPAAAATRHQVQRGLFMDAS